MLVIYRRFYLRKLLMELSWLMKIRIAVVMAVGAIVIGFFAWPLSSINDPLAAVLAVNISLFNLIILVLIAFALGFFAYLLAWPYGREIGILCVPTGLAVWALRSGSIAGLMQQNPKPAQRQALLSLTTWDLFLWIIIVGVGIAGVALAGYIINKRPLFSKIGNTRKGSIDPYLRAFGALVLSLIIAPLCIRIFARNVSMLGNSIATEPAVGQIAFAVIVSFGIAAFCVKVLLHMSYVWPIISTALVSPLVISFSYRNEKLLDFAQQWPATFFPNAVVSILPIQMVAFGTLGSIAGYWLAVRYIYWRKHEAQ